MVWTIETGPADGQIEVHLNISLTPADYGREGGVLAVDPGKTIGWAFLGQHGPLAFGSMPLGEYAYGEAVAGARRLLEKFNPAVLAIETSCVFAGAFSNTLPIEIAGIFQGVGENQIGRRSVSLAPNTVKKSLGSGKLTKIGVRNAVVRMFPEMPSKYGNKIGRPVYFPAHIFDAVAVGICALRMRRGDGR